ncbi:MAG: hypothetical protein HOV81_42900 [Kofleriaceae bacterium]|nr:hypothetical protein [Kofleriaceae bacterium]
MRSVLVAMAALAMGCSGSNSVGVDSGGGGGTEDGGGASDDDGGGTTNQPHSVKLTLANRPTNGAMFSFLVAYQDGSAAWQVAPAPSGDVYTLPIYAPSYGVAFACIGAATGTTTQIRSVTSAHFAIGERDELTLEVPARCSDRAGQTVPLTGTVQNRPFGGVLSVQFGGKTAFVSGQSGGFSLQAPAGTHDLIVSHAVSQGSGDFYVDRVWIERNVTLNGPTTRTINFNNAADPSTYGVNIGPSPIDVRASASTTLYTANGSTLGLVKVSFNLQTKALDDPQMVTSDVYDQSITVSRTGGSATITNATNDPIDQTFVAPPALGAITTTVPTHMPYATLETSWSKYANAIGYQWNAQQQGFQACGNTSCTIAWSAYLSPGVLGTMPAYRMPDLSALPGWKAAFQLVSGAQVVGGVTALTSSAGTADFPTVTPPANGTERAFVRTDFAVTP